MEDWIHRAVQLLSKNHTKAAAGAAAAHVCSKREKSSNEMLVGYAAADRLLQETISRIARNKDVASDEDEENLTLAIGLAKASIPVGNPLLLIFLAQASYYRVELAEEVEALRIAAERP
jgi:hypothetical protein